MVPAKPGRGTKLSVVCCQLPFAVTCGSNLPSAPSLRALATCASAAARFSTGLWLRAMRSASCSERGRASARALSVLLHRQLQTRRLQRRLRIQVATLVGVAALGVAQRETHRVCKNWGIFPEGPCHVRPGTRRSTRSPMSRVPKSPALSLEDSRSELHDELEQLRMEVARMSAELARRTLERTQLQQTIHELTELSLRDPLTA